jgi:hypothetical protein
VSTSSILASNKVDGEGEVRRTQGRGLTVDEDGGSRCDGFLGTVECEGGRSPQRVGWDHGSSWDGGLPRGRGSLPPDIGEVVVFVSFFEGILRAK